MAPVSVPRASQGAQHTALITSPRFAARRDCGCTYQIQVQLVSADYICLASFRPPPVTMHQWNDASWTEVRQRLPTCCQHLPARPAPPSCLSGHLSTSPQVSHTFSDYPPGVRHILFQHGGQDTQYWAGWYGPRVTNSSIIVSNKMTRKPAPSTTLSDKAGAEEAAPSPSRLSSPT